jgi:hypothetical protein
MAVIPLVLRARAGRRILLGGLWSLLLTVQLGAATFPLRWRWSNPAPHGNNIVDLALSANAGLAVEVAELGQIYSSTDLKLWTVRPSGTSLDLRAVAFLGANPARIIITGENGTVLYGDSVETFLPGALLDGPTSDWLEAVAVSPTLAVAVGDNGAIYTSGNGQTWKRQTAAPPATTWLRGVAYGNNAFIAVGESGYIARSLNGTNWVKAASGTATHLNRVAFGFNRFTIAGESGLSLLSTNAGLSWSPDNSGAAQDLFHAAHNGGARLLVGDEEVRLEENGAWSDALTAPNGPPVWTYYADLARPNYFLIAGRTGLMAEGFKTNSSPYFWRSADDSIRHWLFDMVYATNLYVAVGDRATVLTSGNGLDWNLELIPDTLTNSIFLGVGGTTNVLVAAGDQGSLMISPNLSTNLSVLVTNESGGIVLSNYTESSLGLLWFPVSPRPTTNDLQGVCFGHGLYLVTGDNGFIMTSPDGTNWTAQPTRSPKLLSGAASWPGGFVATGDDGALLTSPDGAAWNILDVGTTNWIYKVRYLGGLLIGVGQNGTILTSADGALWQKQPSGSSAWLTDVTRIEDTYFVVGTKGAVLSSSNAVDWVSRGTITKKALYMAATDSAQLVVGGIEGVILRSPVVPDLTPVQILSYARLTSTNQPDTLLNLYLFGGQADQQFTVDRRSGLEATTWMTGPQLEFFDASGTLFYLETINAATAPPLEFYGATLVRP